MADESSRLVVLNKVVYGIVFPLIVTIGIIGSVGNIVLLFVSHRKTPPCYIYMRGTSICDLLFLIVTIPFAVQLSEDWNRWSSEVAAFYFAYVDLYLGNTFAGAGAFLTVAITAERYVAFCHPLRARAWQLAGSRRNRIIAWILATMAAVLYIPYALRYCIVRTDSINGTFVEYYVTENETMIHNLFYLTYDISKEVVFRFAPTVSLIYMNLRIIFRYQRAWAYFKSRKLSGCVVSREEARLRENRRIMFVLGGLSLKFLICTVPEAVLQMLQVLMNDQNQKTFSFGVFRAVANTLELVKNSSTFFVFYMCSVEYRRHFQHCFRRKRNEIDQITSP